MKLIKLIILFSILYIPLHSQASVSFFNNISVDKILIDNDIDIFDDVFGNNDDTANEPEVKVKKKKKDIELNVMYFYSLLINIATILLIFFLVYYPNNKHFENIFTFIMFNLMIFLLTFILNQIKISVGAAFGLFAVFSMLRYRTQSISTKDMTYLFIFIGIGLISAVRMEYHELGIINGTIVLFTYLLDSNLIFKRESSKIIDYENIELIKDGEQDRLLEDLRNRTGMNIHRFEIEKINFLRDTARIKIYHYEKTKK